MNHTKDLVFSSNEKELKIRVPLKRNYRAIVITLLMLLGGANGVISFFVWNKYDFESWLILGLGIVLILFFFRKFLLLLLGEYSLEIKKNKMTVAIIVGGLKLNKLQCELGKMSIAQIDDSKETGSVSMQGLKDVKKLLLSINLAGKIYFEYEGRKRRSFYIEHLSDLRFIVNQINSRG